MALPEICPRQLSAGLLVPTLGRAPIANEMATDDLTGKGDATHVVRTVVQREADVQLVRVVTRALLLRYARREKLEDARNAVR